MAMTIDVLRDVPASIKRCAASGCQQRIEWVTTVAHRRRMPVDYPLIVLRQHELGDGRMVSVIAAASSHFVTCPAVKVFRQRRSQ